MTEYPDRKKNEGLKILVRRSQGKGKNGITTGIQVRNLLPEFSLSFW